MTRFTVVVLLLPYELKIGFVGYHQDHTYSDDTDDQDEFPAWFFEFENECKYQDKSECG